MQRSLRRHFGVSSRTVAVQARLAWYWRWTILVGMVGALAAAGWFAWTLSLGMPPSRVDAEGQLAELQVQVATLEQENNRLRAELAAADSRSKIESGMRADMTRQLKTLADDAASARDETAVLKALLAQHGKSAGVSISRFRVERDGDGYRYRLTLMQDAAQPREFQGQVRLVANVIRDGKAVAMALPITGDNGPPAMALSFRLFQPVEGTFRIPADMTLRSLEVRVFESGAAQPRATQTALVS